MVNHDAGGDDRASGRDRGPCCRASWPASGQPITTGQRGISRPQGSGCDIGAFEAVVPPSLCALANPSQPHQSGSTVVITVTVCDPTTGADLSTPNQTLMATSLTDANGVSDSVEHPGNSFPGNQFVFVPTFGTSGGYQFNLKTSGLPSGTYQLAVTIEGNPAANTGTMTIIVE
ncbi:MAG TPA: choice-of-anchor Q domain-containing protein [Thermomicrobiaceae bacterium]|nr:choice-of-anchor Q domain-containing protein [Thermomicrobiaceae bacterium]